MQHDEGPRLAVSRALRLRGGRTSPSVIQAFAFYLFATLVIASGVMTIAVAQPGAFGAVADPRLLQRGGAVPDPRRRVHRDAAGHRLCRRGRGAVPVRGDDARRRFRRASRRLRALLAVRPRPRSRPARRDRLRGAWPGTRAALDRRGHGPRRPPRTCPISRRSGACSTPAISTSSRRPGWSCWSR